MICMSQVSADELNYMNKIKGLRSINNTMSHIKRNLRTSAQHDEYEVYHKLAQLGLEKSRLNRERENWQEKIDQIDERLRGIAELEAPLQERIAMKGNRVSNRARSFIIQHAGQNTEKERREVVIKY